MILIQLLIANVEATENAMSIAFLTEIQQKLIDMNEKLKSYNDFSSVKSMGDLKIVVDEFMKEYFEPAFSKCTSDIPASNNYSSDFHFTENFFEKIINADKILEILKKDQNFKPLEDSEAYKKTFEIMHSDKLIRMLADKKAIPTTDTTVSLNRMIDYFFESFRIFVGDREFNRLEDINKAENDIASVIKNLNMILEECQTSNWTFKVTDRMKYSQTLIRMTMMVKDSLSGLETLSTTTKLAGNDLEIRARRYLNFHTLLSTVRNMLLIMIKYIDMLTEPGNPSKSQTFHSIIDMFKDIAKSLLFFSVPKSQMKEFISMIIKENSRSPFPFSIFDAEQGDFESNCMRYFLGGIYLKINNPNFHWDIYSLQAIPISQWKNRAGSGKKNVPPPNGPGQRPPPNGPGQRPPPNGTTTSDDKWDLNGVFVMILIGALVLALGLIFYFKKPH